MQDTDDLARSLGRSWTTHAGGGGGDGGSKQKKLRGGSGSEWDSVKLEVPSWGDAPEGDKPKRRTEKKDKKPQAEHVAATERGPRPHGRMTATVVEVATSDSKRKKKRKRSKQQAADDGRAGSSGSGAPSYASIRQERMRVLSAPEPAAADSPHRKRQWDSGALLFRSQHYWVHCD